MGSGLFHQFLASLKASKPSPHTPHEDTQDPTDSTHVGANAMPAALQHTSSFSCGNILVTISEPFLSVWIFSIFAPTWNSQHLESNDTSHQCVWFESGNLDFVQDGQHSFHRKIDCTYVAFCPTLATSSPSIAFPYRREPFLYT
jgi:hypothetical protein